MFSGWSSRCSRGRRTDSSGVCGGQWGGEKVLKGERSPEAPLEVGKVEVDGDLDRIPEGEVTEGIPYMFPRFPDVAVAESDGLPAVEPVVASGEENRYSEVERSSEAPLEVEKAEEDGELDMVSGPVPEPDQGVQEVTTSLPKTPEGNPNGPDDFTQHLDLKEPGDSKELPSEAAQIRNVRMTAHHSQPKAELGN